MARYRKIDPRIWNDAKFRGLSDQAKLVFLFLLTHPNLTVLGAMRATIPGLAAELGWETKGFAKGFEEPLARGMVKADQEAAFIWIPNFLRYNSPDNPNVVKSWQSALDLLPECNLYYQMIQEVKKFLAQLPKAFQDAMPNGMRNGFPNSMPNQEQEQEQEQKKEKEVEREGDARGKTKHRTSCPPPDFQITPTMRAWAIAQVPTVDIETQTPRFIDYWTAHPKLTADWVAAWRNWMRKAAEFSQARTAGAIQSGVSKSQLNEWWSSQGETSYDAD
jgi:hypothetical protein